MPDAQSRTEDVLVSVVDGRVRIGTPFGSGFRTAVLPVHAGTVEIDPFRPHGVPYTDLQFHDADDDRFGWLADLYGVGIARFADQAGDTGDEAVLRWEPGPLHPVLARLGVARWLALWGSAAGGRQALDNRLLDAEIGHLTVRCADALPAGEDTAADHLARAGALLSRLVRPAFDGHAPGTPDEAAARAVRLWTGTAVNLLGAKALAAAEGRAALRARRGDDLAAEDVPLPVLEVPALVQALPPFLQGVGTADRVQVLPGVVDESLDAVRWHSVRDGDHQLVRVSVGAARSGTAARFTPWVRLYEPGRPLPVAMAGMRLDDGQWQAELRVRVTGADDLVVDVFSPEIGRGARVGTEAERGKLERVAADYLGRLRQSVYQEPARLSALAATARTLAADLATLPGSPDPLVGTLTRLAEGADAVEALSSEAWRLTIAELAAMKPGVLGARYHAPA